MEVSPRSQPIVSEESPFLRFLIRSGCIRCNVDLDTKISEKQVNKRDGDGDYVKYLLYRHCM